MSENMYKSACVAFFLAGFVLACWSPLIPLLKAQLVLSNGEMGLILLLFGIGSLIAMPGAGYLTGLLGCQRVLAISLPGAAISLTLLSFSQNVYFLSFFLLVFGVFVGASDVVANVNAAFVQKILGRPIMSSMHALFSFGAFAGSGAISLGFYFGMSIHLLFFVNLLIIISSFIYIFQGLHNIPEKEDSVVFSLPSRPIMLLGFACCMAYLLEGAMLDWSGIFLLAQTHVSVRVAGFGFTSFSVAMMTGRLLGDYGLTSIGDRCMFWLSTLLLFLGLLCILFTSNLVICLVAFFLTGLGLANIAPMIFTFTARIQPGAISRSISQVSVLGYAGILFGPACIGGVASVSSVAWAFSLVAIICIILFSGFSIHLLIHNREV